MPIVNGTRVMNKLQKMHIESKKESNKELITDVLSSDKELIKDDLSTDKELNTYELITDKELIKIVNNAALEMYHIRFITKDEFHNIYNYHNHFSRAFKLIYKCMIECDSKYLNELTIQEIQSCIYIYARVFKILPSFQNLHLNISQTPQPLTGSNILDIAEATTTPVANKSFKNLSRLLQLNTYLNSKMNQCICTTIIFKLTITNYKFYNDVDFNKTAIKKLFEIIDEPQISHWTIPLYKYLINSKYNLSNLV